MINFVFYKYEFGQKIEKSLFSPEGVEVSEDYLNSRLAEDLNTKFDNKTELNLYEFKTDSKGVEFSESYTNEVYRSDNGIFLLQVRNNKLKKYMPKDQNVSQDIGHYPFVWVIVDTRPQSKAILVQLKREAFANPNMVVDLVISYITRELHLPELDWEIKVEKRHCAGSIWDIVKTRTADDNDRVKLLCIKVSQKRPNENNEVDRALQTVLEKLSAPEGEMKLISDDSAKKILDETKVDVRNTVDMLIENKYTLKIGFEKSGTVEYGKNTEAVYGTDDSCVEQFATGNLGMMDHGGLGYDIVPWLDTLMPEDESHTYIVAEKKKKNGRGRKK